jgi:hypothetical protein
MLLSSKLNTSPGLDDTDKTEDGVSTEGGVAPLPTMTEGRVSMRSISHPRANSFGMRSNSFMLRPAAAKRSTLHLQLEDAPRHQSYRKSKLHVESVDSELVSFKEKMVFENYTPKPTNTFLRWNLLWLVLLAVAPYPLWLTFVNCRLSYEITVLINVLLTVNFIYSKSARDVDYSYVSSTMSSVLLF